MFETGICLWEKESEPFGSKFGTITIISSEFKDLVPIMNVILPKLNGQFAQWFRWYTLNYPFEGNAIQSRKLSNTLSLDLGGFRNPVVRNNDPIISSVARVSLPVTEFELEVLSDYRRELLIGTKDSEVSTEFICSMMAPYAEGCDVRAFMELLDGPSDLVFGRCFNDVDTLTAFQWLGNKADLALLEKVLTGLGIKHLKTRTEVAWLLQG